MGVGESADLYYPSWLGIFLRFLQTGFITFLAKTGQKARFYYQELTEIAASRLRIFGKV